jgi:hypothetical protein
MSVNYTQILYNKLANKSRFTKQELESALAPYIENPTTRACCIHDLKQKGVIHNIRQGLYAWEHKKKYIPHISERCKTLYTSIRKQLPYTTICMAETKWLNEFMRHQVFQNYLVIEIEREAMDTVFNKLRESGELAYLNPDAQVYKTYISITENPLIVKPLISESPLQLVDQINMPTLEKLLVDIISDKQTFSTQETEAINIFKTAIEKYSINGNKMLRYASRRNKVNEVENYYQYSS